MTRDEIVNNLLYVPFNEDYKVRSEIKEILTEDEFFENCFLKPCFDKYIENALSSSMKNNEIHDFEIDIEKSSLFQKMQEQTDEFEALETWIVSRQPDLYCFLGDAGTGKTTFLHYLKYKYKNDNICFKIIDIQKAIKEVSILGNYIDIPNFQTLYSKASSTLVISIRDILFKRNKSNNKIDKAKSILNIKSILVAYNNLFKDDFIRTEVDEFFQLPRTLKKDSNIVFNKYLKFYVKCFKNLFKTQDDKHCFSILLELYIFLLICKSKKNHYIIAFDNFERFIGVDEIYNKQLIEFVSELRVIQNFITDNNDQLSNRYQLVISMRHTSVRMFTSQQVTEFMPHTLNLNEWFDASSVLKKRVDWFNSKNILIEDISCLVGILNDMGECGNTLRGLHFKISMLFNYNKRVITRFLINVLFSNTNKPYIDKYNSYWNGKSGLKPDLAKFAARSIIYRLVLNQLREDKFFEYIFVQKEKKTDENTNILEDDSTNYSQKPKEGLEYARKILTILYDYDLDNGDNYATLYISFSVLLNKLFPSAENCIEMLFDENNEAIFKDLVQILFYMNYYDVRKKNWLQFIDIQYNLDYSNHVEIASSKQLMDLIRNNPYEIRLRITNAGKAYLFFVVYYFEYFSCKSIHSKSHEKFFGTKDIPPLLYALPSIDELKNTETEDLLCIKIMNVVLTESLLCISKMNEDGNSILFKQNGMYISHAQRIVNSQKGYLDNFVECLTSIYATYANTDIHLNTKLNMLINKINSIRDCYDPMYIRRDEQ